MPEHTHRPHILPDDLYAATEQDITRFAEERELGMVLPDNSVLHQAARPVDPRKVLSPYIQGILQRMRRAATGQRDAHKQDHRRRTLVGLAAPQIGESLRIILVDVEVDPARKAPGRMECFINPEIMWRSRETEEGREGCFSTGMVWGLVRRHVAVKIKAFNCDGEPVERIFEGFTARIVQHEIDHLDGIRFPDRIKSDKKRHWVHAEEIVLYPSHIRHWRRLCTLDRWNAVKQGKIEV